MYRLICFMIKMNFYFFPKSKRELIAEVLFLRQQLEVINRNKPDIKAKIQGTDRTIVAISKNFISHWKKVCYIFTPDTLIKWHRQLVKRHWAWISSKTNNWKNKIKEETKQLIIQMKKENITWKAERVRGELLKLNIHVSKRTIQKILRTIPNLPAPLHANNNWKTFLKNHTKDILCCDFFTVDTVFFKRFYVFFVLHHLNREILHFNISEHPNQEWVKQQLREATPYINKNTYLIHDHDDKIAHINFEELAIKPVSISYLAPNMNAYAERFVGSVRRECLDHMIILNENHLKKVLKEYIIYYNTMRPHQGIEQNIPKSKIDCNDN